MTNHDLTSPALLIIGVVAIATIFMYSTTWGGLALVCGCVMFLISLQD